MAKFYKAVKIASDIQSSFSASKPIFVPEKLSEQHRRPVQPPRIDVEKTQYSASTALMLHRLRSNRQTSGDGSSWNFLAQNCCVVICLSVC